MRYALLIGSVAILAACADARPEQESATEAESIEVADVYDDSSLQPFENQAVVLYGSVQESLDSGLFLLENERDRRLGDVLVLNESSEDFTVPKSSDIPFGRRV
ncbi:MAG: hypothetical protein VKL39_19395 [Leptolyngbyaceae bacterium]|nr:hypothetical protein [Leptolyngbyaceae bacterium]